MERLTGGDLIRYLDRVRRLYPGGIPLHALEVSAAPEHVEAESRSRADEPSKAVTFVVPSPGPLPTALSTLLDNIMAKGLELTTDDVVVKLCDVADDTSLDDAIGEVLSEHAPKVVIVLDAQRVASGTWHEVQETPILFTRSLGEISADKLHKREFWGHLQDVRILLGIQ